MIYRTVLNTMHGIDVNYKGLEKFILFESDYLYYPKCLVDETYRRYAFVDSNNIYDALKEKLFWIYFD